MSKKKTQVREGEYYAVWGYKAKAVERVDGDLWKFRWANPASEAVVDAKQVVSWEKEKQRRQQEKDKRARLRDETDQARAQGKMLRELLAKQGIKISSQVDKEWRGGGIEPVLKISARGKSISLLTEMLFEALMEEDPSDDLSPLDVLEGER